MTRNDDGRRLTRLGLGDPNRILLGLHQGRRSNNKEKIVIQAFFLSSNAVDAMGLAPSRTGETMVLGVPKICSPQQAAYDE
jgi:hypothetical protein